MRNGCVRGMLLALFDGEERADEVTQHFRYPLESSIALIPAINVGEIYYIFVARKRKAEAAFMLFSIFTRNH